MRTQFCTREMRCSIIIEIFNLILNIASELGGALTNLKKIEETLPAVIAEIAAEKAAVLEDISEA